ncbi:D-glycero-beta-D-manno-heptose-7-phosphate kinase [Engelhardtia mirabilis]|uniref:Bifunctional protein HldE n=1 Tax=Engelhardtia mirabilis TaxID=2528011 RepID=A0A518BPP5_9BACT|nr:Bifunctional protein HldE [Planctomycetes bacterium Pla133]QDV03274.1 Bifunctional protein HldE [Planctomycetes bacterium Pla86]
MAPTPTSSQLVTRLDSLGTPRVLIVGDLILDRYVTGEVTRISPEAAIPILAVGHEDDRLGGAGNVAANLRAMEAQVEILGVVGDDGLGRHCVELFSAIGIDATGCVVDPGRPTTIKTRLVSGVQQMLRVDWESSAPVEGRVEAELLSQLEARIGRADAVILSDYGKGVLTAPVIEAAIAACRAAGKPVLVDPKGSDYARYKGATLLTPNRKEAEQALGRKLSSLEAVPEAAAELQRIAQLDMSVITLGGDGIFFVDQDGQAGRIPTLARAVFDVTGAGDTVISHLALGLAAGWSLGEAVLLANHAAGIVVGRRGAASVTRNEVRAALGESSPSRGKILEPGEVAAVIAEWRAEGKTIAFTNGCFDVLHAGHVQYLRFARSKGDRLIVGVNDDDSVRRLKGETRPVNKIADRLEVLSALEMVDAVVAFGEDTPKEIIERITPHALVKGEDWADKGVVGREWVEQHGGQVHLAPLLAGRSTTSILERAKSGEAAGH